MTYFGLLAIQALLAAYDQGPVTVACLAWSIVLGVLMAGRS